MAATARRGGGVGGGGGDTGGHKRQTQTECWFDNCHQTETGSRGDALWTHSWREVGPRLAVVVLVIAGLVK